MKQPKIRTIVHCVCISIAGLFLMTLSAAEAVVAATQSNFLPVFEPATNEFVGLSLVNTSVVKNEVTVTWTDADGNSTRTANLSLAPGSQRVALVREIFGVAEDPRRGWIRIDSSEPGLLSYMTSGQDGILDGTESASLISTRIILPHVAVNTGFMELEYTDTLVSLINPGTAAANARAELFGLNGGSSGVVTVSIPARGNLTLRISESFRDALPPNNAGGRAFRGYLKISSDAGLAGWLRIDTPLSRRLLRGRGAEEIIPARLAIGSHFVFGSPSLYQSELNFINVGESAITLELAAQLDGSVSGIRVRRTLNPGQGFRENVVSLFAIAVPMVFPPYMVTGHIRIRAADGGVFQGIGDVDITTDGYAAAVLYPLEAAFTSSLTMPFVVSDTEYFTGYAIANPNELLTVQTDVTIELLDRDGNTVGSPRKVSLSPATRFVGMVGEKVRSGYLRIKANGPIALLGSMGTSDGSALAPLPGVP